MEIGQPWCFRGPRGRVSALEMHFRMISSTARLNKMALRGKGAPLFDARVERYGRSLS